MHSYAGMPSVGSTRESKSSHADSEENGHFMKPYEAEVSLAVCIGPETESLHMTNTLTAIQLQNYSPGP